MVSGKGGTGKTTAAAALALSLAADGRRVLLVEVEGRQGLAELFGRDPLPYEERKVAEARGGGEVAALAVDAEAALMEYLEMFYGIRRAGQALTRFGAVDFATTIAPGVRDVLLTGKATEAVRRREGGRRSRREEGPYAYDAVVLDAPPTGRITQFLCVNAEVAGLARMGPIRNHADKAMATIRSSATAVHFVALPEDMPAQEAADGLAEVREAGLNPGFVLLNMVHEPLLPPDVLEAAERGEVDTDALAQGLKAARLDAPRDRASALAREVTAHAQRVGGESAVRQRLRALGQPLLELPFLGGGIDTGALFRLADRLTAQGVAR
ncbi:ArsA-related P-loop ATPase [Nocardiopsis chromatogenes]|uniref:ArsA-related P-loop ATPase n=1 Tax=Nocardiopsis chromatogenes TaxID=280239 RepID=UPI0003478C55|nr:ArsA-related P-loop ATPase [Nocardiopsis chromatogenes]